MTLQRMLKRVKREEGGFTLVELLIVVAIIAILAAIAIPQFTKYRLRSYKTEIDSDLKNSYTAAQAYLTDSPGATINTIGMLTGSGYNQSGGVSYVSSDMTIGAGNIKLLSVPLKAAHKTNTCRVDWNGTFVQVPAP